MHHPMIQIPLAPTDTSGDDALGLLQQGGLSGIEWSGSLDQLFENQNSQAWRIACELQCKRDSPFDSAFLVDDFEEGHWGDDDEFARRDAVEDVKRLLRVAQETGAARISIIPAVVDPKMPRPVTYQNALNRVHDELPAIGRAAESCGVKLCLCAAKKGFLLSPPELRELIDSARSPMIFADIDITGESDLIDWRDWVSTLGPRVGVVGISKTIPDRLVEEVVLVCKAADASNARIVIR